MHMTAKVLRRPLLFGT